MRSQLELNLGHNCNNRCVFCLCGQLTERGLAEPNPVDRMREDLDRAVRAGVARVTFLGGEPTLQPGFDELMAYAATLGFEEIIIFTNGARTGKREFIERITSYGSFSWRFSIQGGDEQTHDRNTKRPGSFKRIVHGLAVLKELGQRTSVNTCVNANNVHSMPLYPDLLAQYSVKEFHADMVRPHSTGDRSEDEVASLVPDYAVVRSRLGEMMQAFERVDGTIRVNIGNLPFCVLPEFAHAIEHGGEFTWTIAGDGQGNARDPLDKYAYQREAHGHLPDCGACLERYRCKGIPDVMLERGDLSLIVPISLDTLRRVPPERRNSAAVLRAYLAASGSVGAAEPPSDCVIEEVGRPASGAATVSVRTPSGAVSFAFTTAGAPRAIARSKDFAVRLHETQAHPADTVRAFHALVAGLRRAGLSTIEVSLTGAELAESLIPPDARARELVRLKHTLQRLRRLGSDATGIRTGKALSLSDTFGVGVQVSDAHGNSGHVRLVLGGGDQVPIRVEFDGRLSEHAERQIRAALDHRATM